MWELDHKEDWALKNWCFQIVVLEKTLESALNSKVIQPVNPKGNQPWVFIERTDAKAETPILWPPDAKNWPTGKDPDAGKDLGQEEQGSRGWESRPASRTQWTWICANSGRQSRTGKPGVLQSMGWQRISYLLKLMIYLIRKSSLQILIWHIYLSSQMITKSKWSKYTYTHLKFKKRYPLYFLSHSHLWWYLHYPWISHQRQTKFLSHPSVSKITQTLGLPLHRESCILSIQIWGRKNNKHV